MKNAFVTVAWPLCLVALLTSTTARAVTTESFTLDQAEDFGAGELEGTAAHSDGYVRLGAATERVPLEGVPVAYSLARKGKKVFIGTGTSGDIYVYDGKKTKLLAKTGELLVSALAVATDGALYAGTLPHGRIYRINLKTGEVKKHAELPDIDHVWALYYDSHRRRLIAATGPSGQLLAVDTVGGRSTVLHQSEASHIMSLTGDGKGTLYAGTSDEAIVLRVRPNDRVDVVHDFPGDEVTALAFRAGALAVATNEFPKTPGAPISKQTNGKADAGASPRVGKGKLWKVGADGRVDLLIERDDTHLTAVQWSSDGAIYAATGAEGRVLKVLLDGTYAIWADVEERQVLALDLNDKSPVFVTGDSAALYEVTPGPPRHAVWTSAPLDAGVLSSFGRLDWRGDGELVFETRSGNTETPNDSWSPWSGRLRKPGKVSSPPGRFVQVRALFPKKNGAELRAVQLYYLPANQTMRVSEIRGEPVSPKNGEDPSQLVLPSTKIELSWDLRNPDGDPPRYRLSFREESQETWRPIFTEDVVLTDDEYVWDTSSIPDGFYLVRVEASDEENNPVDRSSVARAVSKPIRVDNHPPTIDKLGARKGRVEGKASDALGPIARIQYAVNGGRWRDVFPKDGLLDDRVESFEFEVPDVSAGSHPIVSVRVADAAGNQANREIIVKTGK